MYSCSACLSASVVSQCLYCVVLFPVRIPRLSLKGEGMFLSSIIDSCGNEQVRETLLKERGTISGSFSMTGCPKLLPIQTLRLCTLRCKLFIRLELGYLSQSP